MAVVGPWPHGNPMPLSPQERQRLAEIEAALRADPEFHLGFEPDREQQSPTRRTAAAAMMLIGFMLAVAGAAMAPFAVGLVVVLVGFVTVVAGAVMWFVVGHRRLS